MGLRCADLTLLEHQRHGRMILRALQHPAVSDLITTAVTSMSKKSLAIFQQTGHQSGAGLLLFGRMRADFSDGLMCVKGNILQQRCAAFTGLCTKKILCDIHSKLRRQRAVSVAAHAISQQQQQAAFIRQGQRSILVVFAIAQQADALADLFGLIAYDIYTRRPLPNIDKISCQLTPSAA